ncbi:MAG: peptidoglycan-binding protein [Fuerstiella sp.]
MAFSSMRFKGNSRLQQAASNQPVMKFGESNDAVAIVQLALIDAGFPMPISVQKTGLPDGIFRGETKRVTKQFQRMNPGPISDDGIVGQQTMAKLDAMFKSSGPPAPLHITFPALTINLSPDPVRRRQEIVDYLVGQGVTPPRARELSMIIATLNVGRSGLALAGLVKSSLALGTAAFASAIAGVFLFWGGVLISLTNVMETAYRIAANIGFLYGMSAWTFDRGKPHFSKSLLRNIAREGRSGEFPKFLNHWTRGVNKAFEVAPQGRFHVRSGEAGPLPIDAYKVLLRDYGGNKSGRFCLRYATQVANAISSHHERATFMSAVDGGCMYPY